jgi:nicotinamidase-related amidase
VEQASPRGHLWEFDLPLERYGASRTGLLLIDPFNDFLSDGGKLWPSVKASAAAVDLVAHLRALVEAARPAGVTVLYVPHRRWREGDFDRWRHPTPWQRTIDREALFADGTWGGDWHPELEPQPDDVIIQEHWGQSGFFNTDLDMQLKQRGIQNLILAGVAADMCVTATGRFGAELGYRVAMVRDATGALSAEAIGAAHAIAATFAHAIVTTDDVVAALKKA